MKLIMDFQENNEIMVTSSDDEKHFYLIKFDKNMNKMYAWYDDKEIGYEDDFKNYPETVGRFFASLIDYYVKACDLFG
jgi:hypothetical protein